MNILNDKTERDKMVRGIKRSYFLCFCFVNYSNEFLIRHFFQNVSHLRQAIDCTCNDKTVQPQTQAASNLTPNNARVTSTLDTSLPLQLKVLTS